MHGFVGGDDAMRFKSSVLATVTCMALLSTPANAQPCQQVNFSADFDTAVIEGVVSPEGIVCFAMNMAPHNNNLGLSISGRNIVFGFNDGFHARDAITETQLVPEGPVVRVNVVQMMRSVQAENFRLTVTFLPPGNG